MSPLIKKFFDIEEIDSMFGRAVRGEFRQEFEANWTGNPVPSQMFERLWSVADELGVSVEVGGVCEDDSLYCVVYGDYRHWPLRVIRVFDAAFQAGESEAVLIHELAHAHKWEERDLEWYEEEYYACKVACLVSDAFDINVGSQRGRKRDLARRIRFGPSPHPITQMAEETAVTFIEMLENV